jgi:hypothetical protein
MSKNKYQVGERDSHGNRNFDYAKAFADLKQVVLGKKKMSKDLYDVMYLRFTIAHYNMLGWLHNYNGNWASLADEICLSAYGDFASPNPEPFDDIRRFLR